MNTKKSQIQQIKQVGKLSLSNLWRNKFLSIATVFIIAIIIFILNVILGVNQMTQTALNTLNEKVDIKIYIKEMTTQPKIEDLISDLENQDIVKTVNYISKKNALEKIQILHPDITETFEKYKLENPLPRSINVITNSPNDHKKIVEFLNKDKYKTILSNVNTSEDKNSILNSVSTNLEKITNFTNHITLWVILVFILGGTLIITNSIQVTIFSRKKEISIMKFLGGSNIFIKAPFILEAIIYGILSIILSLILLKIVSVNLNMNIKEFIGNKRFLSIIEVELLITTIIAIISALIAVHKELQRKI